MEDKLIAVRLGDIRHVTLDMDGTIYSSRTLFDFTRPFLVTTLELGIGYTFLTNISSRSACHVAHLEKLDLGVQIDQLFTSSLNVLVWLATGLPKERRNCWQIRKAKTIAGTTGTGS